MSVTVPAGIDFGNTRSILSAFIINNNDQSKSSVEIIPDRNGIKEPSSQLFYGEKGFSSATAATLYSSRNPSNCIQFVKSSIKRNYSSTDEKLKNIVKAMRDKDDRIVYHIDGYNDITPSQLAGDYICDRIKDIAVHCGVSSSNIYLTIAVPNYLINDTTVDPDFYEGLHSSIAALESETLKYSLISEVDAIALEYGASRDSTEPLVVLFVGVGFYEAHAFVVQYTENAFEILHKESTNKVSSFNLDSIIMDLSRKEFDDTKDEDGDDGEFDPDRGFFYNYPSFKKAKEELSNENNHEVEIELKRYDPQNQALQFFIEIRAEDFNEEIQNTEMCNEFKDMIQKCIDACKEKKVTIQKVEISSDGVRSRCFRTIVNDVTKINLYRPAKHVITRGCSLYSCYQTYKEKPFSKLVSVFCSSVKPLRIANTTSEQMNEAMQQNREMSKQKEEAGKAKDNALNDFHGEVKKIRDRIEEKNLENLYALNQRELLSIIENFTSQVNKTDIETNRVNELKDEFVKEVQEAMDRFTVQYNEEQLRKQKQREEEEERQRREEAERQRREEERAQEERKRKIQFLREEYIHSFLMNQYVPKSSQEELQKDLSMLNDEHFQIKTLPPFCQHQLDVSHLYHKDDPYDFERRLHRPRDDGPPRHSRNPNELGVDEPEFYKRESYNHLKQGLKKDKPKDLFPPRPTYYLANAPRTPSTSLSSETPSTQLLALDSGLWYVGPVHEGLPDTSEHPDLIGRLVRPVQDGAYFQMVYEGAFRQGEYSGQGCLYQNNTLWCRGEFSNGELTSGIQVNANQSFYQGSFNRGKLHGQGSIQLRNGISIYEGVWNEGQLSGQVKYKFFNLEGNCEMTNGMSEDLQILEDRIVFLRETRMFTFYYSGDILVEIVDKTKETHERDSNSFIYFPSSQSYISFKIGEGAQCVLASNKPYSPYKFCFLS